MPVEHARAAGRAHAAPQGPAVQRGGNLDRHAPGRAPLPTRVLEVARDGRERVGLARPDVDTAVPVPVRPQAQHHAGQELRVAGRSRPGADQPRARRTPVDEAERCDELLLEQRPPPPVVGKRRERAQQIEVARHRAVARLVPVDGHGDRWRHARLGLVAAEQRQDALVPALPARDQRGADVLRPVRRERRDGVRIVDPARLRPIKLNHARVVGQRGQHGVDRRGAHPRPDRPRPELG